jgi:uroporphyrinogen-III synthase
MVTIIARDAEGAERVAAKLRALGEFALAAPVLVWASGDPPPPLAENAQIMVTSPRGADVLADALADISKARGRRGELRPWQILALAGPTTRALVRRGIEATVVAEGGAAALAALAGPAPLVHLTSDLGGAESAKSRPDRVLWTGYRVVCPASLPDPVMKALRGPSYALWFGSPSAVQNFETLAPGAVLKASRVWAHGGTTLAELEGMGVAVIDRVFPGVPGE